MTTPLTSHSDSQALNLEVSRLEQRLGEVRALLRPQNEAKAKAAFGEEQRTLRRAFFVVTTWLVVLTIGSVFAVGALITGAWVPAANVLGVLAGVLAGALGSAVSALTSTLQRRANGWELSDGFPYPYDDKKRERFSLAMAPFLAARPALGAATGLLVIIALQGAVFGTATSAAGLARDTFWALLGGLFAKTLIEKLKTTFDQFVGK